MQDLIEHLHSLGFNPPNLNLDGTIYRFPHKGSKDAGWLIGWQNKNIKTGAPYVVAKFGCWKTGEDYVYKPKGLSREDHAAIASQMDSARKKAKEERLARQSEAAAKAEKNFPKGQTEGSTPYMERKKIPQLYGARRWDDTLQVPTVDIHGKLWGIQYITPDLKNNKRFMTGQKTDGVFHLIGKIQGDEAIVCEGFATGTSLYQATGRAVFVAFNTGNLVAVAKAIKEKHPDLKLLIAGDDDRFNEQNAGRQKAEEAGLITQSPVIFPVFKSDDGQPTDFNDLHVIEGLDAIRRLIHDEPEPKHGFIPLGYNDKRYFFLELRSKDIIDLTAFGKHQLMQLAPGKYWQERYPGKEGKADWDNAADDIISKSRELGPFDTRRVRGTGVWEDDGRIVLNTGRRLVVDGIPRALTRYDSHFVYVPNMNRMPDLHSLPLTAAEGRKLIDVCCMFKWQDPRSGHLLAGWLALARVAGALPIRPHAWLTGGSGTGKSTIMDRVIAHALGGPKGKIYLQGGSTEAGVRQFINGSSLPVIFDEFESTNDTTRARHDAILELTRNLWSATQGSIAKGSATGQAMSYALACPVLLSSIRVTLSNDADRSRFSILELVPHGSNPEDWKRIQAAVAEITPEFGERLFARMINRVRDLRSSYRVLGEVLSGKVSQRYGQQVGMLLAGWWCLINDGVITDADARAMADELDLEQQKEEETITDEVECLQHLLTSRVRIQDPGSPLAPSIEATVESIIHSGNASQHEALKEYGVKVEKDGILIADRSAELLKIFKGTKWSDNWARSLRRIKGAATIGARQFSRKESKHRATKVPFDS